MKPRALLAFLLLLLFGACVGPTPAELATYQVVAPDHKRYVENDPQLDAAQKAARFDLLESWRVRVGASK
jgi:hypothetical protein